MQYTVIWFHQVKVETDGNKQVTKLGHHGYHEVDRSSPQDALAEVSQFYNPDFLRKCTMSVFKGLPFKDRTKYTRLVQRFDQL